MLKFKEVDNIKELAQLSAEIWHEYWTYILSLEQIDYMLDKFQSEIAIMEQISQDNYSYFYINLNDEKIGYIGLSRKPDFLFLSKLYIKKDFRHKGLGTEAFEFIKQFATENNYKKIHLSVNKYNKNTIDAYKKWGFEITDDVVTYIGNGFVMDDYVMEYELKD